MWWDCARCGTSNQPDRKACWKCGSDSESRPTSASGMALPYPGTVFVTTRRFGYLEQGRVEDALTAGSAQYREGYLRRGGRIADSEGYLSIEDDAVAFCADSGQVSVWYYPQIRSYSVKRGRVLWKLTLRLLGSRAHFKIGHELAANADYILAAKGVPSR